MRTFFKWLKNKFKKKNNVDKEQLTDLVSNTIDNVDKLIPDFGPGTVIRYRNNIEGDIDLFYIVDIEPSEYSKNCKYVLIPFQSYIDNNGEIDDDELVIIPSNMLEDLLRVPILETLVPLNSIKSHVKTN